MTRTELTDSERRKLRLEYEEVLGLIRQGCAIYPDDVQDLVTRLMAADWVNRAAEITGEARKRWPQSQVSM